MTVDSPEVQYPSAIRFSPGTIDPIVDSASRTTDGASEAFDVERFDQIVGLIRVTAVSGTSPTLDVRLQTSYDGGKNWVDVAAANQLTSAHASGVGEVVAFESKGYPPDDPAATTDGSLTAATVKDWPLGDRCRWKWALGGTDPDFTFSITQKMRRD